MSWFTLLPYLLMQCWWYLFQALEFPYKNFSSFQVFLSRLCKENTHMLACWCLIAAGKFCWLRSVKFHKDLWYSWHRFFVHQNTNRTLIRKSNKIWPFVSFSVLLEAIEQYLSCWSWYNIQIIISMAEKENGLFRNVQKCDLWTSLFSMSGYFVLISWYFQTIQAYDSGFLGVSAHSKCHHMQSNAENKIKEQSCSNRL